ncbi:hypothetical protein [Aminobacterium mobile]|uniref:hypothetical protein n=1 Tax=Aminobacterium mobile TaxID=81467 RepID=UPI0033148C39
MAPKLKDILEREPGTMSRRNEIKEFGWEVGIPMLSNPFVLVEFIVFFLFIWIVVTGIALIVIVSTSHSFNFWVLGYALQAGGIAAALFAGVFLCIALLFFGNRFYGKYYLDNDGILYTTVRGQAFSKAPLFTVRPFPVGRIDMNKKAEKRVYWQNVDTIEPFEKWRVIGLKKKSKTILRLYCPDEEIYDRALVWCQEILKSKKQEET